MKHGISTAIFLSEALGTKKTISLDSMVSRLTSVGYEGIELLPYDPSVVDVSRIKEMLRDETEISSIATGAIAFHYKVTMLDPEARNRRICLNLLQQYIRLAYEFEAPLVVIGSAIGKLQAHQRRERDIKQLTEYLQTSNELAQDLGVTLAIEPVNRYERNFLNTVEEGLALLEAVNSDNIRLLVDTFHMNIEEVAAEDSIKNAGKEIVHVHIADNNRWPPGYGHIDFKKIFTALKEIGYDGYASIECLPKPDLNTAIETSINYLRSITF